MTESLNDTGYGHSGLHRLFESKHFKMRPYGDPANDQYKALKTFLQRYLTPASFKTYWAFLCALEPYVKNAINPIVIKSAALKSGFDGNKINVKRLMCFNETFVRLSDEKAEEMIGLVTTVLAPYFRDNQWIPETLYPELFPTESGFGFTLSTQTGIPLNDRATNRQRFLVDNSEQWQAILAGRKLAIEIAEEEKERKRLIKEAADAAKPTKTRSCSQLGCNCHIDITTNSIQKLNERTWKKCKGKRCSTWVCPTHFTELEAHESFCPRCT